MELDFRKGGVLGGVWILSAVIAFFVGRRPGDVTGSAQIDQLSEHQSAYPVSPSDPAQPDSAHPQNRHPNRRTSTVGRLIGFTRQLGTAELARLLPEMTEKMDAAEVEQALRRLLDQVRPGPARELARLELIDRWAQLDAAAAFQHIDTIADPDRRAPLKKRAIKGWASVDPAAAHAWIRSAGDLPDKALRSVWQGIADSKDLEATLAFIPSLGPGSNAYSEPHEIWDVYMTLHSLYQKDDKAVVAWVEQLPPGELRNRAFHSVVDQLARHDPRAAKDWIAAQANSSNRTEAYVELAESWARHEPDAAVEWAASLPAGTDGLERIYDRLFTRFIQYDYLNAADYLVEQEPSPALDTAFEVYIDKTKAIDPGTTMEWAIAITDTDRRWAAMTSVASVWRDRDPAALEQFVDGVELTDSQRNSLLGK